MLAEPYIQRIADEASITAAQADRAVGLFANGATIPFVARYRKDVTGGLGEEQLETVFARFQHWSDFADRKQFVLETIEKQGQLDDGLRARIEQCFDRGLLEDLYLPYKKARRSKATTAREQGLAPLAELIWRQATTDKPVAEVAEEFVDKAKGVASADDAITGAKHIIAERIAINPEFRSRLRADMLKTGSIRTTGTRITEKTKTKYETYYDYTEKVSDIPSHRFLAVQRGVKEGKLRLEIAMDDAAFVASILDHILESAESEFATLIREAAEDAYHRLLRPSIVNDILKTIQRRADEEAVRVFRANAENLLLAPPAGKIAVIGLDPGHKSGCKLAAVNEHGAYLESAVIFPTPPESKIEEAEAALSALIDKHGIKGIAIGSGTGSREAATFVRQFLAKRNDDVFWALINEAGASIYSASPLAREEYPDIDVTIRGAVSIAHRLQNPIAELVKIEPKHIGVGQYQHDVDQRILRESLHRCVVNCVSRVGVDLNTASAQLLRYVSGIKGKIARNIVRHREANGGFSRREQLLEVEGIGPKVYEQSAGFLRIQNGEEPLDGTGVHPEAYPVVAKLAEVSGVDYPVLIGNPAPLNSVDLEKFVTGNIGVMTLEDIREELARPCRDPRSEFRAPKFDDAVYTVDALEEGRDVEGVVTNVTDFGAFVDIGVQQDGLIHLSELANHFVRDPHSVVRVGDIVRVRVIKVDKEKPRISLSMKALQPASASQNRGRAQRRSAQSEGDAASASGDRSGSRSSKPRDRARSARKRKRKSGSQRGGRRPQQEKPAESSKQPASGKMNTLLADQLAELRDKFGS